MVIGAGRGHGGRGVAYTLPKQSIGSGHHIIISQSVGMKPAEKIDGWREGIPSATAREKSHEETTKKTQHQGRGIPFVCLCGNIPLLPPDSRIPHERTPLSCGNAMDSGSRISAAAGGK